MRYKSLDGKEKSSGWVLKSNILRDGHVVHKVLIAEHFQPPKR